MPRSTNSIDQLAIEITASAQNANQELDGLINRITRLSNVLNGVNVKTFTADIRDMGNAVKGVNANSLTKQMSSLSKSMANYSRATNRVTTSTRTGSQAFNSFKNGVNGIYSGLTKINSKLNDFASKMKRANKETKNFAQTVGLLYARFFLLIRGTKSLVGAVKSSMNYIEVLNYFDASFGQVAERGVSQWSQMGYDSAEAYYNSFSERAKEVTRDMSGFFPEADGTLTPSGMASLGMNPQKLMQYQAQFAQMSSSMGNTSEQALILSEVLTKIGADLASVKNMEFEDVWRDMASGLVGMSRTLDKYGANIRSANMEMKLHELGIDATVNSLSQADKALLRTIILLDSSKYAWADLAETLNTPANQFRMLSNNVKLLGQMIGNILLPVVAKILPYLNAFVIVLQRLFTWLAKILGIDLSGLMGKNTGFDNSGISDLLDDAEDLSGALDDDTNSAKKLKKQLQGFDALNNLTTNEDAGKGKEVGLASGLLNDAFLDAVNDYLKAWDDAFKNLENKAQALADKIQKFFLDLLYPIRKAWQAVGKDVINAWKKAFKSIRGLLGDIGRDFMKMWHEKETILMFKNIFEIIKDIGLVVGTLADKFREAWNYNDTGLKIFRDIRDIVLIITEHIKEMADATVEWAKELDLTPLLSKIEEYLNSIKPVADAVWGAIQNFYEKVLLPLGKWTLEKGLPDLVQVFIDFNEKVDWDALRERLSKLWEHLEPFAEKVGEGFIIFIDRVAKALADFVGGEKFENFLKKVEEWMDNVSAEDIADFFEKVAKALIALKIAVKVWSVLAPAIAVIGSFFKIIKGAVGFGKGFWSVAKKMASGLKLLSSAVSTDMIALGGSGATGLAGFWEFLNMDAQALISSGSVATVGATIGTALMGGITASILGFKFGKWLGENLFPNDASYYENFSWFGEGGFFDYVGKAFDDLKEKINEKTGGITGDIENWFNNQLKPLFDQNALDIAAWGLQTGVEFATWYNDKVAPIFDQENWNLLFDAMPYAWEYAKSLFDTWYENSSFAKWKSEKIDPLFDKENWRLLFEGIKLGAEIAWGNLKSWWNTNVIQRLENAKKKISNFVDNIRKTVEKLKFNFSFNAKLEQNGKLPTVRASGQVFANGGFPEDGMFFANHNELVGKFTNGRTAVANNEQIVSGIQNGVYGAMSESNTLLMEQNALLQAILEKETGINANDLFRSVQSSANSYYKMTGNKAFA